MIDTIFFGIISAIMIASGVLVFYQKSIMRAVIALTVAFTSSAIIFFILGQAFIALLQLFVFVGGLSTYLIVAVSSEYKKINLKGFIRLCIVAILVCAGMMLLLFKATFNTSQAAESMSSFFIEVFQSYFPIIFMALVMLFLTAIGSVIVIRRFVKLVT